MTGHDDRTAANADRHARASHRHRSDGRRGCVALRVRSGPSARLRAVLPVLNRTLMRCVNKAKRATWSTLDGSCGLPG